METGEKRLHSPKLGTTLTLSHTMLYTVHIYININIYLSILSITVALCPLSLYILSLSFTISHSLSLSLYYASCCLSSPLSWFSSFAVSLLLLSSGPLLDFCILSSNISRVRYVFTMSRRCRRGQRW